MLGWGVSCEPVLAALWRMDCRAQIRKREAVLEFRLRGYQCLDFGAKVQIKSNSPLQRDVETAPYRLGEVSLMEDKGEQPERGAFSVAQSLLPQNILEQSRS